MDGYELGREAVVSTYHFHEIVAVNLELGLPLKHVFLEIRICVLDSLDEEVKVASQTCAVRCASFVNCKDTLATVDQRAQNLHFSQCVCRLLTPCPVDWL